jgi:hypothetical protein
MEPTHPTALTAPSHSYVRLTPERRAAFLEALSRGQTVSAAARAIGSSRQYLYEIRADDEDFASAWDAAAESGVDVLEDEAYRRAVEGVETPVFQAGQLVGYRREYSDALLSLLLKSKRYNERIILAGERKQQQQTEPVMTPERLAYVATEWTKLMDEQRRRLAPPAATYEGEARELP